MTSYENGAIKTLTALTFPTATPVNAVNATGVFTITSTVADAETVTIGTEIYEFKTSGSAATGHIKVDISGGATAAASATALISAITANSALVTATTGGSGIANITAKVAGTVGNAIASTDTVANGSFGASKLASGVDGTVTANIGLQFEDASYYYLASAVNTTSGKNWLRIAKGSAY